MDGPLARARQPAAERAAPTVRAGDFALAAVWLLIALYVLTFGALSLLRHAAHETNAFDLGFTDQAVWNTLHGRPFRFSLFQGDVHTKEEFKDFHELRAGGADSLLAYHAELLLAPIALLYALWPDPRTLLLLQTIVLALGALPAYWLARDHLGSELAGVTFAAVYLLTPALAAANLADFHAVALTATLLLFAFRHLARRENRRFALFAGLALLAKEEISLLVAMLGLYALLGQRRGRFGLATVFVGAAYFLFATQVLIPAHADGRPSNFLERYAYLGATPGEMLANAVTDPARIVEKLVTPEIGHYTLSLLAPAGFLSLFHPPTLLLAAPEFLINALSTFDLMYSGGAHYSASIVPFVVISAIYGLGALARLAARCGLSYSKAVRALLVPLLAVSLASHYLTNVTPLSRNFAPPRPTAHDALAARFLAAIPSDAAVSAQTGLYPHVSRRERAYLFPSINDAEYVLLDVTGTPWPASALGLKHHVDELRARDEFGILAGEDGYLLLQRGHRDGGMFPGEFFSFLSADEREIAHPLVARFGEELEILGYDLAWRVAPGTARRTAILTTYWRALATPSGKYRFAFFLIRADGAVVSVYAGGSAATAWLPLARWRPGRIVRLELPPLDVTDVAEIAVGLVGPGDAHDPATRLGPITAPDPSVRTLADATLLRLVTLSARQGS